MKSGNKGVAVIFNLQSIFYTLVNLNKHDCFPSSQRIKKNKQIFDFLNWPNFAIFEKILKFCISEDFHEFIKISKRI